MIIVKLIGGLGNQMFQYATGRCLSDRLNTELKLDISAFKSYALHNYNLSSFNIIENFASRNDMNRVRMPKKNTISDLFRKVRLDLSQETVINHRKENFFHFDPQILDLPNNTYLDGYWQSEKYFKDIEEIIRREFSLKIPSDAFNKELGSKISSVNSISIHVRRGDYLADRVTYQTHGTCDVDYYNNAIDKILKNIDKPHFFIFSDDPMWAKSHITVDAPTEYISYNGPSKNYEDLHLMSLCHHHIIANSTFSWWGAWLNPNLEKIVFVPKNWFNQSQNDTRDLIPESWNKI